MTRTDKTFETIAREQLQIETLETRKHDSLDFHTVSVWEVKKALEAAYNAGRDAAGETELVSVMRENFTPHAVALIAAKQQPCYAKGPDAEEAERASAWFAEQIIKLLGTEQYNALCDELGL